MLQLSNVEVIRAIVSCVPLCAIMSHIYSESCPSEDPDCIALYLPIWNTILCMNNVID